MIGAVLVNYHTNEQVYRMAELYAKIDIIKQIIIVNNDSDKESVEFFSKKNNNKIIIIHEKENLGYSKGNNVGCRFLVSIPEIKYIIISNSDISIKEECIRNILTKFNCNDKLAAIAPVTLNANGKPEPIVTFNLNILVVILRLIVPNRIINLFYDIFKTKKNNIVETHYLLGSFFIVKAKSLKDINYFDENLFMYCEELVLGERFKRKGLIEGVVLDEAYYHLHEYTQESLDKKLKKISLECLSEQYYFENYKNYSKISLALVKFLQRIYITERYLVWKYL